MTQAFRLAPPSLLKPLDYTALLWAIFFDCLFWNGIPNTLTLIRALVLIMRGIVSTRRSKN